MRTGTKGSTNFYINAALSLALILILIAITKPFFVSQGKNAAIGIKRASVPVIFEGPGESIYDIDKVKKSIPGPKGEEIEYSDFKAMYENSDKANVGGNMVEAWSRVKPEDKTRLSEGFDKQIIASREILKENPENKHAKNILYIAEALKKMFKEGFNYKFKNKK